MKNKGEAGKNERPSNGPSQFEYAAVALAQAEKWQEAAAQFLEAIKVSPEKPRLKSHASVCFSKVFQHDRAVALIREARQQAPEDLVVLTGYAEVMSAAGYVAEALTSYQQILARNSMSQPEEQAMHLYNCAVAADKTGDHALGQDYYKQALALKPDSWRYWYNYGTSLIKTDTPRHAIQAFDRALALEPAEKRCLFNRAVMRLKLMDWAGGFADYEHRFGGDRDEDLIGARLSLLCPHLKKAIPADLQPVSTLSGTKLVTYGEQGYGDHIQFLRYLPYLQARGVAIGYYRDEGWEALSRYIDLYPGIGQQFKGPSASILKELAAGTYSGENRWFLPARPASDQEQAPFLMAPIASLPFLCGTDKETIPPPCPVPVPDSLQDKWQQRLSGLPRPLIGVVASCNPAAKTGASRSIPLEKLAEVLLPDVAGLEAAGKSPSSSATLLVLQKDIPDADKSYAESHPAIVDLSDEISDFLDIAAILDKLTLAVSVDTAFVHLAGNQQACPVVALINPLVDWRWPHGADSSPWYPGMKVLSCTTDGSWVAALSDLKQLITR